MRRRSSRVVLAVTAVAIVAIAGAATYAVAEIGGGGVIGGCFKSENGQLRLIDPATDRCHPSETALSWSQTGPQGRRATQAARTCRAARATDREGPRGPGPQGAPGPQGPADRKGQRDRKGNRAPSTLRTSIRRASRMLASQDATRTPSPLAVSSSAPARQHPVQIPNLGTVTFVCSSNTTTVSLMFRTRAPGSVTHSQVSTATRPPTPLAAWARATSISRPTACRARTTPSFASTAN